MAISARIEELERKFNENPRRYFAPLANEYRKAGDVAHAIELCRAYLPQQPGHMSGHIVFGQALFESGELDEAQTVFQTALTLDPENLIALRHLGDIAKARGDVPSARSWYQRVLDADPRNEEIADQLKALDEMPTPAADSPAADASLGWGDINPEQPAAESADSAASEAKPRESFADDHALELLESAQHGASKPAGSPAEDGIERSTEAELPTDKRRESSEVTELLAGGGEVADDRRTSDGSSAVQREGGSAVEVESVEFVPPAPDDIPPSAPGLETGHEAAVGGPVTNTTRPGGGIAAEPPAAFVTETMAELYLQQGFTEEAMNVYRQLLAQNPDDTALRDRVAQLERGARSSVGVAAISDDVIEEAKRRAATPRRRTIRTFLGAIAARRPPVREEGAPAEPAAQETEPVSDIAAYAAADVLDEAPSAAAPAETPDFAYASPTAGEEQAPEAARLEAQSSELATPPDEFVEGPDLSALAGMPTSHSGGRRFREAQVPSEEPGIDVRASGGTAQRDSGATPDADAVGLAALFGTAEVRDSDQRAAETLSGAFPAIPEQPRAAARHPRPDRDPATVTGEPARTASSELSLDHVFRDTGTRSSGGRQRSEFSFDQFFAPKDGDDVQANGDGDTESDGEPSSDDIQQFNSWLEALKKK